MFPLAGVDPGFEPAVSGNGRNVGFGIWETVEIVSVGFNLGESERLGLPYIDLGRGSSHTGIALDRRYLVYLFLSP
jgi:hypothetical protein